MRTLPFLSLCLASSLFATSAEAQFATAKKAAQTKASPPMGLPTSNFVASTGSDSCANAASADAITGSGIYAVSNTAASTGAPTASCGSIGNDVWFYWTATASGNAVVSTCGGVGSDSVIAVWNDGAPAGSCPTTQVTCNDDTCGLQSEVTFPVVAGQKFFLELGGYNGATYSGTFSITQSGATANDNCSTPLAISGTGIYGFSTSGATTGAQGQNEASCLSFGTTGIGTDIWYAWTAPASGAATVSLCGSTGIDSKIAAYAGAGCPAGAAIACNDDTCGLQSEIGFACVAGQTYSLQVGNYPGSTTGSGTFSITIVNPDSCATPTPISGLGAFAFDNTAATTGTQGQAEGACLFFGTTGITNDLWYAWTAPTSGTATVSLCGQAGIDSKLAVYGGAGCPSGAALACNDDSCGLQSQLSFTAVAGQVYAIQLGNYPGATPGTGTFTIDIPVAPPSGCQHDDGTAENSVGLTAGGDIVGLHRFGGVGTSSVSAISAAFGAPGFPNPAINGLAFRVAIWEDPNDDGVPNDLVLLATANGVIANEATNTFVSVSLGAPVIVSGVYFVGVAVLHAPNTYPLALDQSQSSLGRAFVAGEIGAPINLANMSGAALPPTDMDAVGLPGVWLLRADCGAPTGTAYCFGDGSGTGCPCGNSGAAGNGCANSLFASGSNLTASGTASLAADSVVLSSNSTPNSSILFFQGTNQDSGGSGTVFGDGLRCAGGSVVRLGTKTAVGNAAQYPGPGDQSVSVRGLIGAPGTRTYQGWYRNSAAFCTTSTFNLTNGYQIVWGS